MRSPRQQIKTRSPFPACRVGHLVILAVGVMFLTGCNTLQLSDRVIGPDYSPENVHRMSGRLAPEVRRVAVLPVTFDARGVDAETGRATLEPVLYRELGKTKRFELISVSPEQLRHWTGRTAWTAEERLSVDLLKLLRDELGCEAVLFSRVTHFHAYPPLVVGLNLKLVDAEHPKFLWAVDEVFDAADPSVVNGARRYQQRQEQLPAALADSHSILNSPSRFGHYAASALFATLPER
jgi:hypothetical protein